MRIPFPVWPKEEIKMVEKKMDETALFPKLGEIKIRKHRTAPETWKLKSVTVTQVLQTEAQSCGSSRKGPSSESRLAS